MFEVGCWYPVMIKNAVKNVSLLKNVNEDQMML